MISHNYNDFMKASKYFHLEIWYYHDNTMHLINRYLSSFQEVLSLMKPLSQVIQYSLLYEEIYYYNPLKQGMVIKKVLLF